MVTADAVSEMLARMRDPSGLATSRATAAILLTHAQRVVNLGIHEVLDRTSLTLTPMQLIYPLRQAVPNSALVIGVQDWESRDLPLVPWRELKYTDPEWFRAVGARPVLASRMGRDLLVVYPSIRVTRTVTVISVKLTSDLTQGDQVLVDLPDMDVPPMLDFGVALGALRLHQYAVMDAMLQRVLGAMAAALHSKEAA